MVNLIPEHSFMIMIFVLEREVICNYTCPYSFKLVPVADLVYHDPQVVFLMC